MASTKKQTKNKNLSVYYWATARIALGFTFLWAFLDKLLGFGFTTCRDPKTEVIATMCEKAWISGGSPTSGFLELATKGPFADTFKLLAGNGFVDTLFMTGLLGIGVALILGIGIRIATVSGVTLMGLMWLSMLWPENNPFIDEHVIYSIILLGILVSNKDQVWGMRNKWVRQGIVKKYPILE